MWPTQISSPRPFRRSQGHHPHSLAQPFRRSQGHCCVANSNLVASAFPTFSRPPSSLLLMWLTQISSTQPFQRSQGHRPHCYSCGRLRSRRLSLSDVLKATVLIAAHVADSDLVDSAFPTFLRLPSSLPLLCGRLRSRRLSLSDVLKAIILIATHVADSDLVPSAFPTFSRPLLCGQLNFFFLTKNSLKKTHQVMKPRVPKHKLQMRNDSYILL